MRETALRLLPGENKHSRRFDLLQGCDFAVFDNEFVNHVGKILDLELEPFIGDQLLVGLALRPRATGRRGKVARIYSAVFVLE